MNHKSRLAVFLVAALLQVPALTRAGDLSVIDTYLNERRVAAGLSPLYSSLHEMARQLHCSRSTVRRRLREVHHDAS